MPSATCRTTQRETHAQIDYRPRAVGSLGRHSAPERWLHLSLIPAAAGIWLHVLYEIGARW